jgi:hypothetical protein
VIFTASFNHSEVLESGGGRQGGHTSLPHPKICHPCSISVIGGKISITADLETSVNPRNLHPFMPALVMIDVKRKLVITICSDTVTDTGSFPN